MRPLSFFFFCICSVATAQINEDFSDGNFSQPTVWSGNDSKFIVNSSKQLQLNSTGTDTSYLSISTTTADSMEWNFWLKLSFSPSDNNYVKIYLVADQTDLKVPLNGYFIRMGENGSFDSVDLWEQSGVVETKIIDGANGHCGKSTNTLKVKATRSSTGTWKLYCDTLAGINYCMEGAAIDMKHSITKAFGISCKYTSSNSSKFYFDDFYIGPIRQDTMAASITQVNAVSESQVDVYFNEPVELASAEVLANYFVNEGIGSPISAKRDALKADLVHLIFPNSFLTSKKYLLNATQIKDLVGNSNLNTSSEFVLPDPATVNDIVINEVLFDPRAGGVDFVELYNRSSKVIDLGKLVLCTFDSIAGQLASIHPLSSTRKLIYPGQYIVLTTNQEIVKQQYSTENPTAFLEMSVLPAMNIESGIVVLADLSNAVIDRFDYRQDMHFSLLNTTKGVSLERLDVNQASQNRNNWHSAASTVGYASPGYKNSQVLDVNANQEVTITGKIFSPDNDGFEDVLGINYLFDSPGNVANISLFNSAGILVRSLTQNSLLGSSGFYVWDGLDSKQELCPVGIYILHFQIFNPSGESRDFKRALVLAHKN